MQVIFSFTSHDLQLSSWSWIFSYLKFNLSTIVSKPFVHSTVIPQFQHFALDSKPLETVMVLYIAYPSVLCISTSPRLCAALDTECVFNTHTDQILIIPNHSSFWSQSFITQFSVHDFCGSFFCTNFDIQILPLAF